MEELFNQRRINETTFSFLFKPPGQESYVDFGAPVLDNIRNQSEIVNVTVLDDFFWSQWNQGIAIGSPNSRY